MHHNISKDFRRVLAEFGLIRHARPDYHFGKIVDTLIHKLGSLEELALTSDSDLIEILDTIKKELKDDIAITVTD